MLTHAQTIFMRWFSIRTRFRPFVVASRMRVRLSEDKLRKFLESPQNTVCLLFCISVNAHRCADDIREMIFNSDTILALCRCLKDEYSLVRSQAAEVLGIAGNYGLFTLLYFS